MTVDGELTWRAGTGAPLVLLHSVFTTWRMWSPLLDRLGTAYDVLGLTMAGHGGRTWPAGVPPALDHLVDDVERQMDEAGWTAAHLVGNSLGGLVAMELGRRGRALSITSFAPGGSGPVPDRRLPRLVRLTWWQTRAARPLMPWTMRAPVVRRAALRLVMEHGERLTLEECLSLADDVLSTDLPALTSLIDRIAARGVPPFPDPGVPCHVAWPGRDRDTPARRYREGWRDLAPHATFSTVPGAGHVPVVDAPDDVLQVIRATATSAGTAP